MPLYRMLFLSVLLLTFGGACSDDDAPDIALEDAELSFIDSTGWIFVRPPAAMLASKDIPATETMRLLNAANFALRRTTDMYFRFDKANAQIVDTAVVDSKPGIRYRTYLWKISNVDIGYAYQISIEKNSYVFKLYQCVINRSPWELQASAEESLSRTSGVINFYGIYNRPDLDYSLTWKLEDDDYSLDVLKPWDDYKEIHVNINQRTRAGSVAATEHVIIDDAETDIKSESQWTESGAGSWTQYDAQGNIMDSGTWEPAQ